jgi:Protein of unknown function (DUF1569)
MATTAGRRALTFARLDEIMPDVDRLLRGYTTVGRWSLGQICNHLTMAVNGSLDGFSTKVPWLVRKMIAPIFLRRMLKSGTMPEGVKVPQSVLPVANLDDRAEAEALRAALKRFAEHSGALIDHPFFGPLGRDRWDLLHRIHCAHHLSFARPAS